MRTMFDALLDWSRLEAGMLQPSVHAVDIQPLLERLGHEYAALARERGLRFRLQLSQALASTDPVLLERVLRNLLTNAVAYTAEGEVQLLCGRYGDSARLRIRVADTGPGFTDAGRERLFNAFERGETHPGHRDGLGLGLAIVRHTADLLGHPLRLRSSVRHGSVFTLIVPAGDGVAAVPLPPMDPTLHGRRVLVVDDDERVLDEMHSLLARWGAHVECAPDLRSAQAQLGGGWPDLLVVDQHLPDGNGREFIERARSRCPGLKAVLITGDASFVDGAQEAGVDLIVLLKPVSPMRLKSVIHFLLMERERRAASA
jgi:CheY-like chemotaxis protein/anti-sigma regulatory factor (Ser/Thr protein kinase)